MLDWLRNILGKRDERARPHGLMIRARFDAAQTTPDNRKHWSNADPLSADAAASPEVRRTLRNRVRPPSGERTRRVGGSAAHNDAFFRLRPKSRFLKALRAEFSWDLS